MRTVFRIQEGSEYYVIEYVSVEQGSNTTSTYSGIETATVTLADKKVSSSIKGLEKKKGKDDIQVY